MKNGTGHGNHHQAGGQNINDDDGQGQSLDEVRIWRLQASTESELNLTWTIDSSHFHVGSPQSGSRRIW